ncbi:CRAL/TRIO domain-containing protein [Xylaria sp. CBS 124048]|nr:CRAL/TRIO domain-containing protein [Xylaria sp. CBS 124048]
MSAAASAPFAPPGTPGNLTADEEQKLRETWTHILRLGGVGVGGVDGGISDAGTAGAGLTLSNLRQQLSDPSPQRFRKGLWDAVQASDPDAVVLRFLRARKWDVARAAEMLVSAINWRLERDIAGSIIRSGEGVALQTEPMTDDDRALLAQYRSGKSFVHGVDHDGRLVYVVRVALHDPRAQSAAAMESYVLHNIESIRLLVRPPVDRCCILFDMAGFGMKNMDFNIARFLVSVFEARYPETLGVVLIHNAPFVFWGIWNAIKGWLDPVIAAKIHFTRQPADLLQFIPAENLQTCYGGTDPWEYAYIEPVAGENARLDEAEKRAEIEAKREELIREFELETTAWAAGKGDAKKRADVAGRLGANYRRLDPYIRARTLYHRTGAVPDS